MDSSLRETIEAIFANVCDRRWSIDATLWQQRSLQTSRCVENDLDTKQEDMEGAAKDRVRL